jgi:NTE family protein
MTAPESKERETSAPMLAVLLAGGGARAAYQVGVLSHIGQRMPELDLHILTGVSAGAINTGFLAAHRGSFRSGAEGLRRKWASLTTEEVFRADPPSLARIGVQWGASLVSGGSRLAPRVHSLVDTAPLRDFLNRHVSPSGIEANLRDGQLKAIAISAVSYQTGRTVSFIAGSTPIRPSHENARHRTIRAGIGVDHIMASAAIPLLFPAVKVGQQYYGDGSFRHSAPLSPAIQLGADRILAISARFPRTFSEPRSVDGVGYPPPARIIGLLLNSAFLDTLEWDAARLERVNRLLKGLAEDAPERQGLRHIDLLVVRPSEDIGRIAAEYERRLPRLLRFLVRGLGTPRTRSADFLSYLLFESAYITRLVELGQRDAESAWPRLYPFLSSESSIVS